MIRPIRNRQSANRNRRGIVLLAVMMVLVLLTLAALQYAEMTTAEYRAADSFQRSAQARALAESGIYYAAAVLSTPPTSSTSSGSVINIYNNSSLFGGILVSQNDNTRLQGRFSIVSPVGPDQMGQSPTFYYGVIDEGSKLNLNTLLALDSSGQTMNTLLTNLNLPGLTPNVVSAMVDWVNPNNNANPQPNGATEPFYSSQSPPYHCKTGPLDTLDELLLVEGVTSVLLYGPDSNRNGILDPEEQINGGTLIPGWNSYLTVNSRELNVSSSGTPRIYVNDQNLQTLYQNLSQALGPTLANYIVAYRLYGGSSTTGGGGTSGGASGNGGGASGNGGGASGGGTGASGASGGNSGASANAQSANALNVSTLLTQQPKQNIGSLYQLINSQVTVPSQQQGGQSSVYASPLNNPSSQATLLPLLLDQVTTVQTPEIFARVNINTAPQAILSVLPGMTPAYVQSIVSARPITGAGDPTDPTFQTPTWLLTKANIPVNVLQGLDRYITCRSQVYRVQSVGYFDGGGPTARIEAVIDTNNGQPRIINWRDLTEMGKVFDFSASGGNPAPGANQSPQQQ